MGTDIVHILNRSHGFDSLWFNTPRKIVLTQPGFECLNFLKECSLAYIAEITDHTLQALAS